MVQRSERLKINVPMQVEIQLAIQPKIKRGIRLRIQPGDRRELRLGEHLAVERRVQVGVGVRGDVEMERATQPLTQFAARLKTRLPELPGELRPVFREAQPRIRDEAQTSVRTPVWSEFQ